MRLRPHGMRVASLSGVENSGYCNLEPTDGTGWLYDSDTVHVVFVASIWQSAPVENSLAQKFVRGDHAVHDGALKYALEKDARDKGATAQAAFVMTELKVLI